MVSRTLIATLLASAACAATPAWAKWETAHGAAIQPGRNCPSTHDRDPKLRASDGRPFDVPAGFRGEIEVYGHGIDLSPDAGVSGLPQVTASLARKVGGAENNVRGCGAIGSAVIRLAVDANAASDTGTLRIGDEVIPLRIVNASISSATWSEATMRREPSTTSGGGGGSTTTRLITVDTSGATGCSSASCPQQPSGGVLVGSTGGSSLLTRTADTPSGIGECIDDVGGSIALESRTLTLTLPQARTDAALACLTRPAFFEVGGSAARGDIGGFRAGLTYQYPSFGVTMVPPRFSGSTIGLSGPAALAAPDAQVQKIAMTRTTAAGFVGERRVALTSSSGGAGTLTLVLRSDPGNGIQTIQGVPFAGPRTTSVFDVRFDFLGAMRAGGEPVAWRLRPVSGSNPANCFTATAGTLTATSAIGRLTLTATERAGCAAASYELQIAPARNGVGVFAEPYVATAGFALPELTRAILTPTRPTTLN